MLLVAGVAGVAGFARRRPDRQDLRPS